MSGRGLDTFLRFLVSGAFNTAATYALYLLLLLAFPYWLSYSVAYAAGIVLAYVLSRDFVFKRRLTGQRLLAFPLVYVVQYLIGLAVAAAWVDLLGLPAWLAPAAALAITVPITFLMTRAVFERHVPDGAQPAGGQVALAPASRARSAALALCLLLPPLVVVALLWLPFGFRLGGLIEEWDVLGLFSLRGLFFLADGDSPLAAHSIRPLTVLPHAIAYALDSASFDYWHVITMLSLVVKGATAGWLVWIMCGSIGWALAGSVLVLVYPADTMQLAFRGLHINVSVALFLLATCLLVSAHYQRVRAAAFATAAGGAALLLASILMYEAAMALLPFPLLVLVAREGIRPALHRVRQRPELAGAWLAAAAAFVVYAWMASSGRATYQGSVAGTSVIATLAGTGAKLFSVGAVRALLGGWYDAAGMLRHEFSRYGYLALATLACCGAVAIARSIVHRRSAASFGETTGDPNPPSALRMAACGFVLLLLGYAPFLISPAHLAITQRTYLFATPGAAFVLIALLMFVARRAWPAGALSFAAFTMLGLAAQLFQFQQYVTISEHQRTVLRGIVESFPGDLGKRTLIVLDGSNRLNHTWMLRDNLVLALSYLYAQPVTNVEICLAPSRAWQRLDGLGRPGECLQETAGWRFRRAAPVGGPGVPPVAPVPDVLVPAADAVVVRLREDGSPELQQGLDGHRRRLANGSGEMERRYRGILLPQAPSRLVQQFTRVRETGSYRTDFGRWWSIEEPIHGSGWREADWTIGSFRHDAGSWSVTATASLVFELQPRGRAGRMSGRFDAMAGGREGFQLRLNGHPVAARWADERRFDADLLPGMLLDGRNVLEVRARPAPDYYGLGAKMTWLQVDVR